MKPSKLNLPKLIESYFQDIEDWGDEEVYTSEYLLVCESVLGDCKKLILESKQSSLSLLREHVKDAPAIQKEVVEDFILYATCSD